MLTDYFYVQLQESIQVALSVESITEVITLARAEICPIPGVSPALLGVVNQRGRLLWVLELSDLFLEYPVKRSRPQDRLTLVVISTNIAKTQCQLGCVVSALKGILPLDSAQFQPVPASSSASIRSYVSGITEIEQSSVAIIKIDAVLAALQTSASSI